MKISHITWAAMTGITLSLAFLGGGFLWTEGATWLARSRGERLTEAFTTALRVADVLVAERISTKEMLSSATPMESKATMNVARSRTDVMVNRLESDLDAGGLANADFRTSLVKGRSLLTKLRARVDDTLSGQTDDRATFSAEYYAAMSDVIGTVRPIVVPIQMALLEVAGPAVAFHQLALLAVDARISAGIRSGRLGDAMLGRRPPTPEEIAFMDRMAGHVDGLAEQMQASALQLGSPPPIVNAIGAMKAGYFTIGKQILDRILASVKNNEPYPMSAEAFFNEISLPQQSILLVRDAALDEARRVTGIDRERAETAFAVAALIVTTGAAGAFAFCLLLRRRVIHPILQLTTTM